MVIDVFPPVENADEDGLLALGGDLDVATLINAYGQGIFPWPISPSIPLAWFSPDPRGVLFYEDLHISRTLKKTINKKEGLWTVSFNKSFHEVIHNCAISKNRKGQNNMTWITKDIIQSYLNLHHSGHAYSIEVREDDDLIAGVYGVCIGNFVSGESMFYLKPDASKFALVKLMEHLKTLGISWLDTQMVTPVVENLGGKEIPRSEFLTHLSKAVNSGQLKSPVYSLS